MAVVLPMPLRPSSVTTSPAPTVKPTSNSTGVGPYPARRDLYRARSPLHATERLSCPVILFQGLDDRVVPPSQAERMVAALRAKGLPVAYVPFDG